MTGKDIVRKLTSRKFWLAVAAFVSGVIAAFGGDPGTAETIAGLVMQGAAVLGYLLAEGLADAKHAEDYAVLDGIALEDIIGEAGEPPNE